MRKIVLNRSMIVVTELCFGALPIGPVQKNLSVGESAMVISAALRHGLNFIDTAQMYGTYEPIRLAMAATGIRPVIATKSTASTYEDMEAAVLEARNKMDIDKIDIFLLHAARPEDNLFETRSSAFRCLLDYKQKGVIRAVGISTHKVQTVVQAALHPEIDIVFPILNKIGMGILGGSRGDMENAIGECFTHDKDVYIMKALAGGTLIDDYEGAIAYVRGFSGGKIPIAMGMTSINEVRMNVQCFSDEQISEQPERLSKNDKKYYVVPSLCKDCGECMEACHSSAITKKNGRLPSVDEHQCLRCGYCVAACPQFAIRMI
jgi:aryl-alcohol dehydrogenase-like predicted oxidoreductase